jgi:hypothetical protein
LCACPDFEVAMLRHFQMPVNNAVRKKMPAERVQSFSASLRLAAAAFIGSFWFSFALVHNHL